MFQVGIYRGVVLTESERSIHGIKLDKEKWLDAVREHQKHARINKLHLGTFMATEE